MTALGTSSGPARTRTLGSGLRDGTPTATRCGYAYGNPLRDSRGSRGRARIIRGLLRSGATGADLATALGAGLLLNAAQLQLWEDEPQPAGGPALLTGEGEPLDAGLVGDAR